MKQVILQYTAVPKTMPVSSPSSCVCYGLLGTEPESERTRTPQARKSKAGISFCLLGSVPEYQHVAPGHRETHNCGQAIDAVAVQHPALMLSIDRHAIRLPRLTAQTNSRLHHNVVLEVCAAGHENRVPGTR